MQDARTPPANTRRVYGGLYADPDAARAGINRFRESGYDQDRLGVVTRDREEAEDDRRDARDRLEQRLHLRARVRPRRERRFHHQPRVLHDLLARVRLQDAIRHVARDREAEQVDPEPRSGAEDRVPDSRAEHRRLVLGVPRQSPVAEDCELERECAVISRPDAKRPKEGEPELGIGHDHTAAEQLIEHRTPVGIIGNRLTLGGIERAIAIAAHQAGIAQEQRLQPAAFASLAVAAVVEDPGGEGEGTNRQKIFAEVAEHPDVAD